MTTVYSGEVTGSDVSPDQKLRAACCVAPLVSAIYVKIYLYSNIFLPPGRG